MKSKTSYICTSCEAIYPAWQGKCTSCGQWNTIVKDNLDGSKLSVPVSRANTLNYSLSEVHTSKPRKTLSVNSFNTILGGGVVDGQVILFAGEPGIGKSTLLTQICSNSDLRILYISGEESVEQIAKRASRIAEFEQFSNTKFSNDVELESILSNIKSKDYDLVIVDSIQTVYSQSVSGFAGSMNQIRECANYITDYAKKSNVPVIMIGQITKEGNIAGPKILEHLVDTVLYFEGDKKNDTRLLKVTKNRFGSTSEIGIFEMTESGLQEIKDAGLYFIDQFLDQEGVAYTVYQEGTVSLVLEVQALCNKSNYSYPKRVSNGYDTKRLEMLIAILSKKLNLGLDEHDIYVNIVGGIKVEDTSADLAVAVAIISSLLSKKIGAKACFLGEISLTGDIRPVSKFELRKNSADKFGLKNIYSKTDFTNLRELAKELFRK